MYVIKTNIALYDLIKRFNRSYVFIFSFVKISNSLLPKVLYFQLSFYSNLHVIIKEYIYMYFIFQNALATAINLYHKKYITLVMEDFLKIKRYCEREEIWCNCNAVDKEWHRHNAMFITGYLCQSLLRVVYVPIHYIRLFMGNINIVHFVHFKIAFRTSL